MGDSVQLRAFGLLQKALAVASKDGFVPVSAHAEGIQTILLDRHLTFRYILVNGVLAGAVNARWHPRALQAISPLEGAYDARSLCHKVLVPFERKHLKNALGGSNEPFVNNPARLPSVELSNPVRAGRDRELQAELFKVLEGLAKSSQEDAFDALCDCLFYALERRKQMTSLLPLGVKPSTTDLTSIVDFGTAFVSKSLEGASCAILTASLLQVLADALDLPWRVEAHNVNQSGASSREVSDIDIYRGKVLELSIEVKDKAFTVEDAEHAGRKIAEAGHNSLVLVLGPRGRIENGGAEDILARNSALGVTTNFIEMSALLQVVAGLARQATSLELYEVLRKISATARVSDNAIEHLSETARTFGLIR
jgi:hypothetical protein